MTSGLLEVAFLYRPHPHKNRPHKNLTEYQLPIVPNSVTLIIHHWNVCQYFIVSLFWRSCWLTVIAYYKLAVAYLYWLVISLCQGGREGLSHLTLMMSVVNQLIYLQCKTSFLQRNRKFVVKNIIVESKFAVPTFCKESKKGTLRNHRIFPSHFFGLQTS